ncbi:MAG: trigger factor [Treponema sp.]|nr:trigger factor [Treponema sp.]
MNITKDIARLEHSSLKLTITVGKDDLQSEYNNLVKEYSKNIQYPGFRKGKVPKDVLERKFGDALKAETLGRVVEKSVEDVFGDEGFPKEDKPLPYSTPNIAEEEKLELELDKDLTFSVVYDVLPKVTVEKWQGFEIEVPDVAITDEDINRELEFVRERNAIVMDKDEGAAEKGDVVTVNYCELDEAGEILPNSERQDFVFTLGTGSNYYQFDDEITGMAKGETKEFTKSYAESTGDAEASQEAFPILKELAGKTKKLRVTLTALKTKKLPEADDDLAQDVDEKFKTLEDLKQNIRERLDKDLDRRIRNIKTDMLLEKIMEAVPVEIPESMINLELDSRWRNLARRFNTDADGLYKIMGKNSGGVQGVLDSWKPDAVRALHSRLIVETLIEDLKLEASDEEAEKEIERQAKDSGAPAEDFKKYYEQEQMKEYLKEDIKEQKLFDRLFLENIIKPGKKEKYIDFISKNE